MSSCRINSNVDGLQTIGGSLPWNSAPGVVLAGRSGRAGDADASVKEAVAEMILWSAADLPPEDQAILLAIARHESGFNPSAKNPSSTAYGVFQIINSTWCALGYDTESRSDARAQVEAGVALYRENMKILDRRTGPCHGDQRLIEMYRLHHDGPGIKDFGGREIATRWVLPLFREISPLLGGSGPRQ